MSISPKGKSMLEDDIMGETTSYEVSSYLPTSLNGSAVRQCLECNCNWGVAGVTGKAGACWECFKVEPCCGEPCTFSKGLYCCCCYTCCNICVQAKLLAASNDQEYYFINHCGPILIALVLICVSFGIGFGLAALYKATYAIIIFGFFIFILIGMLIRRNVRLKYNVGSPLSWIGDYLMALFCCPCIYCQVFRAVPTDAWDWFGDIKRRGCSCLEGSTLGKIIRF